MCYAVPLCVCVCCRLQDLAFHLSANFVLQAVLAATSTPSQVRMCVHAKCVYTKLVCACVRTRACVCQKCRI